MGLIILHNIVIQKWHQTVLICQLTLVGILDTAIKSHIATQASVISSSQRPIWYSEDSTSVSAEDLFYHKLLSHKLQNHSYINLGNGFLLLEHGNTATDILIWRLNCLEISQNIAHNKIVIKNHDLYFPVTKWIPSIKYYLFPNWSYIYLMKDLGVNQCGFHMLWTLWFSAQIINRMESQTSPCWRPKIIWTILWRNQTAHYKQRHKDIK